MIEKRIDFFIRKKINEKVGFYISNKTKISPNTFTALGILTSFFSFLIVIKFGLFWGAFAVLISSFFDVIDGSVAKVKNKNTNFGAFFDDIADRIGEMFYFSAIFWLNNSLSVFLAAITSFLVSYLNASARARGFKIFSGKILGRPGRIVLLFWLMIFNHLLPISLTIWLIVLLNLFTFFKRVKEVKKQSD